MDLSSLNKDCLRSIFRHLKLLERLKLEQVSKKWRNIMPYDDISVLDLRRLDWAQQCLRVEIWLGGRDDVVADFWLHCALDQILPRCGRFLKELYVGSIFIFLNPDILQKIVLFCPRLSKFGCIYGWFHVGCVPIFQQFEHLTCLELEKPALFSDDGRLGREGSQVEQFRQQLEDVISSHPSIEEVKLDGGCGAFLPRNENGRLRKIQSYVVPAFSHEYLPAVARCYRNLVALHLECPALNNIPDFSPIGTMQHLETLHLGSTEDDLSYENLQVICQNCSKLSRLELPGCSLESFTPLILLRNLSQLNMSHSEHFCDSDLNAIARHGKLEELHANGSSISDSGLTCLANFCQNLCVLVVSDTNVGDLGLVCILQKCKKLSRLIVENTDVSYASLKAAGAAPNLRQLTVSNDSYVMNDDNALKQLYSVKKFEMSIEFDGDPDWDFVVFYFE